MTLRKSLLIGLATLAALGALQGVAALLGNDDLRREMTTQAELLEAVGDTASAQIAFERADRAAQDSRRAPDPAAARVLTERFRTESVAMRSALAGAARLEPALAPLIDAVTDWLRLTDLRLLTSNAGGQTRLLREDLLADLRDARQREIAAALTSVLHDSTKARDVAARGASRVRTAILAFVALSSVGALVIALLLHRRVLRPLAALTAATRHLVVGNLDHLVEGTNRVDEIGAVATALEALRRGTLHAHSIEAAATLERRISDARIHHLAHHDPLTGLANRTLLQERLKRELALARSTGKGLALFCIDLDGFKAVNDSSGHATGDALLIEVAQRLLGVVRETDTVARVGGDEFVVVTPVQTLHPHHAEQLAARITKVLAEMYGLVGNNRAVVSASLGAAVFPTDGETIDLLLANADTAMYRVKQNGGNGYAFFRDEMDAEAHARRVLEQDVRLAITRGQLSLAYQPQWSIKHERVVGFEALLRWNHPERGTISPDAFVSIAEANGSIVPIGAWVLREACIEAARWTQDLRVAVNVSPIQFQKCDMATLVAETLSDTGLDSARLELELTEGMLFHNSVRTLDALRQIRESGVSIAMDDFGTGYSSLSSLRAFPFDRLKIDRSFVKELAISRDSAAIVHAVLGLASGLGLPVVAEGVEDQEQFDLLRAAGCAEVQGYLFGRPSPISTFAAVTNPMAEQAATLT